MAPQDLLQRFPANCLEYDFVSKGFPVELAPPGVVCFRLVIQRECWDSRSSLGIYERTSARGLRRKNGDGIVPPALAEQGVTQDAWSQHVLEDLPEALASLNHCCFEFWCCMFTCCISNLTCTKSNRARLQQAGLQWEETFNRYLTKLGCFAKVVTHTYKQGATGNGQYGGNRVVHGLIIAHTPDTVAILKERGRYTGHKASSADLRSFVLFS